MPGYAAPGYATPGYATPGYEVPGYAAPGYADPGYTAPGYAAPQYAAPAYAAPGYPPSPYGAAYQFPGQYQQFRPPTEGLAIASLVLSCVGIASLCLYGVGGLVLGPLGAILGHVAKRRIRNTGAGGDGMALAGIIVGWIATGLGLVIAGLIVAFIVHDSGDTI
jgi:hypothetical protein